jgi:hypothetical protein
MVCIIHQIVHIITRPEPAYGRNGGNPTLRTTLPVMKALGIKLSAKPAAVR